jgi:hypothetical protein
MEFWPEEERYFSVFLPKALYTSYSSMEESTMRIDYAS